LASSALEEKVERDYSEAAGWKASKKWKKFAPGVTN
jgi:hypothetical protein